MSLGPLGPTTLVLALAGFVGAWVRDVFYSDSGRFTPTFLFCGVWALQVVLTFVTGAQVSVESLLFHAPVSALMTAIACWATQRLISVFVS